MKIFQGEGMKNTLDQRNDRKRARERAKRKYLGMAKEDVFNSGASEEDDRTNKGN